MELFCVMRWIKYRLVTGISTVLNGSEKAVSSNQKTVHILRYQEAVWTQILRNGEVENFFENFSTEPYREAGWAPSLDISETETEFVVKADVPGVDPKELDISYEDDVLTIKGEKKEEHEEKKDNYHRIERSYGSFSRAIKLPPSADADRIEAASKNGVLTLTIPKREE